MKSKITIMLVFFTISGFLQAQQQDNTNSLITLQDYLRQAALNNEDLKAKFQQWKFALEQIPQSKALDDPKFTFSHFIEEVETRVGPQKNKFGIMQVFPWFGTIEAKTDIAAANAKSAKQNYEAGKLKLFYEVKNAFYEYCYLGTAIETAKENLELLEHFEEIARVKYRSATAAHPDIIRVQVELAKLEDVVESLEKLRQPTAARLNAILNRPAGAELPWPEKEGIQKIRIEQDEIVNALKQNNPQLAQLNWEIEAAKSKVELAKKKFYPNIGVGIDWIQTDDAMNRGTPDSGKDPVVLMFSMNIPIWQDSYKAAERQAQSNVRKTRHQKVDAENQKIAQAFKLMYKVEDTQRKMKLYGDTLVSKASELVEASESAYMVGTVDFLSLVDSQRMLLKYRLDHERAIADNQQAIAELEALVGIELKGYGNEK